MCFASRFLFNSSDLETSAKYVTVPLFSVGEASARSCALPLSKTAKFVLRFEAFHDAAGIN